MSTRVVRRRQSDLPSPSLRSRGFTGIKRCDAAAPVVAVNKLPLRNGSRRMAPYSGEVPRVIASVRRAHHNMPAGVAWGSLHAEASAHVVDF